jgi:hypothetical protein
VTLPQREAGRPKEGVGMSCRYTQSCVHSLPPSSFCWTVDFDALRLRCSGSGGFELDQTFATLGELDEVYRARVVPLLSPTQVSHFSSRIPSWFPFVPEHEWVSPQPVNHQSGFALSEA